MTQNILVVGAGLAGCTCARLLAEAGHQVYVIEKEKQIGGICRDERDEQHNCFVHSCGPHLFHTNEKWIWDFVNRFGKFRELKHKVMAYARSREHKEIRRYFEFPVNYNTLTEFFEATIATEKAAMKYMKPLKIDNPKNFEEACLAAVGEEIYRMFFKGYSETQWRRKCTELPADLLSRVPIKFNKDPYLFPDTYQGLPEEGYTKLMENMLNHENISVYLDTPFEKFNEPNAYDAVIYTGGFEGLPYRSTRFIIVESHDEKYPVVNLPEHLAFTRRTNYSLLHKIDPEKKARPDYMVGYEMPAKDNECNTLLPITTKENVEKFKDASTEFLRKYPNAILIGRLATYQYLDMDDVIDQCYSVLYGHQLIDNKSHEN